MNPLRQHSRLSFEQLEDRTMLTMFTVNSLANDSVVPGVVTLRSAIDAANNNDNPTVVDSIRFASGILNGTINLTTALPEITEPVSIEVDPFFPFSSDRVTVNRSGSFSGAALDFNVATGAASQFHRVQGLRITGFAGDGILIRDLPTNTTFTMELNEIDGNGGDGVHIDLPTGKNISQYIVTDNIITNNFYGIRVIDVDSRFTISGNRIGTDGDSTGNGNASHGIYISDCSASPTLASSVLSNTISGNGGDGIRLVDSFAISTLGGITSNEIGLDANSTFVIPNSGNGVTLLRSRMQVEFNDIGGNLGHGVEINDSNLVEVISNGIGTNRLGTHLDFGNGGAGVFVGSPTGGSDFASVTSNDIYYNDSHGILINGGSKDSTIQSNRLYFNAGDGVAVSQITTTGHRITRNNFRENAELQIDLGNDGVTVNDPGDIDSGPNKLLNTPTLRSGLVELAGGEWSIPLDVEFDAAGDYVFEFYRYNYLTNEWTFVHAEEIGSVSAGPSQLEATIAGGVVNEGDILAAIAIGDSGTNLNNTSEFSTPMLLSAFAPTLAVTTAQDESAAGYGFFDLSLREALELASDGNHPGQDVIAFAPWVQEVVLTLGTLDVDSDVKIVGPEGTALAVIDANGEDHVFSATSDLELYRLFLTGASAEAVFVSTSSLVDLDLDVVEIAGNGGGVYFSSNGSLTVSSSTIAENEGRGIFAAAQDAILVNTTISGNQSDDKGAGLYVGYHASASEVELVHVTITENRALKFQSGALPEDSAGGVYVEADMDVYMYNSIVAYNFAGNGTAIYDLGVGGGSPYQGTIGGLGNLIGEKRNSNYYGGGIIINSNDPKLTPLGDHGGLTRTHALELGSYAIDGGDNSVLFDEDYEEFELVKDQRGFLRPIDHPSAGRPNQAKADIGALELASNESYP
jgi:hypothetical protein